MAAGWPESNNHNQAPSAPSEPSEPQESESQSENNKKNDLSDEGSYTLSSSKEASYSEARGCHHCESHGERQ